MLQSRHRMTQNLQGHVDYYIQDGNKSSKDDKRLLTE